MVARRNEFPPFHDSNPAGHFIFIHLYNLRLGRYNCGVKVTSATGRAIAGILSFPARLKYRRDDNGTIMESLCCFRLERTTFNRTYDWRSHFDDIRLPVNYRYFLNFGGLR